MSKHEMRVNVIDKTSKGNDVESQKENTTNIKLNRQILSRDKIKFSKKIGFTKSKKDKMSELLSDFKNQIPIPELTPVKRNNKPRLHFRPKAGKRMFERRSGTGRGKEISKDGAGGKTIWGNVDQLAKQESIEYMYQEHLQQTEAKSFYPPIKETNKENLFKNENLETKNFDNFDNSSSNLAKDSTWSQVSDEYEGLSHSLNLKSKQEIKRRKKAGSITNEEKSDLLEILKDSITYSEYLKNLKEKNKGLPNSQGNSYTVPAESLSSHSKSFQLKPNFGSYNSRFSEKKKQKKKISNMDEEKLNLMLSQKLSLTNEERQQSTVQRC